jgi:hypothetical protein
MDRMERRKRMIMKMNVVEYVLRTGCVVIVLTFVAIIAFWGYAAYDAWLKPPSPMWSGSYNSYDADTISTRDSVVKEVPKQEMKMVSPTSSSSSKRSSYKPNDNMQRFDPPSEDDMDDNGMSRYMNAYDDEDWE